MHQKKPSLDLISSLNQHMEFERSSSTSSETGLVTVENRGTGTVVARRMYECTFCKRGFTNAQALGGHMNIHRRDRLNKSKLQNVVVEDHDHEFDQLLLTHRCFPVNSRGYEQVVEANLSLRIGLMREDGFGFERIGENGVVQGDEIDLELRLGS